jgi:hypothetical protein
MTATSASWTHVLLYRDDNRAVALLGSDPANGFAGFSEPLAENGYRRTMGLCPHDRTRPALYHLSRSRAIILRSSARTWIGAWKNRKPGCG